MNHPQGRPFTPEERKFIVSIKQYFDRNKQASEARDSSAQRTADALGIGIATVHRVMASYHKDPENLDAPPKPRGCPEYAIGAFYQEMVRSYIRAANAEGKYITLETIAKYLQEESPESSEFHDRTLARTLDRWGFEFGKGIRTQHLKEKDHVIAARRRYLQPIELCWGILKNELARHCDFTMKNLEIQLSQAFSKITRAICAKIIKKVRAIEDDFWKEDAEFEEK